MTGADLARGARAARPGLRVLLVSGYAENAGIEPGLPRLTKPFREDELAASLAQLQLVFSGFRQFVMAPWKGLPAATPDPPAVCKPLSAVSLDGQPYGNLERSSKN